jgi:hypothetical protein
MAMGCDLCVGSVLPAGATVTAPVCASGSSTCTSTFSWTPTLSSTGAVICYQGTATSTSTGQVITSQSQLCINVNIGALPTTVTAFPASGTCGGPTALAARLTRTADSAPIISRTITFAYTDDPSTVLCSALTDTTGLASCSYSPPLPIPAPGRSFTATFTAIANEFLQSSAASNSVVNTGASSTLQAPFAGPASIGYPFDVYGGLTRVFTDGGIYPPVGSIIKFTLTDPNGVQTVLTGTCVAVRCPPFASSPALTVATVLYVCLCVCSSAPTMNAAAQTFLGVSRTFGVAPVTFPASVMNSLGTYTVKTEYAGDACLLGATATTGSFVAYQRIAITTAGASVTCEKPVTLSGLLAQLPQNAALSGRTVSTSFSGPSTVTTNSATTSASGSVSFSRTITVAGTYTATWSTATGTTESDSTGAKVTNEEETAAVTVLSAATSAAVLTTPVAYFQNVAFTVSTRINRVLSPNEPVVGGSVSFVITGASAQTRTGNGLSCLLCRLSNAAVLVLIC